jgi:D-inositol-3-phosphate glycosyltransferase
LIKALSLLGQKYVLIIVGRGDRAPLINLASDLGVADRLYLIDSVDNDNLPYYHAMADVFCTPSRWEGFGIVFIEALASGSSVVVTSDVAPMNEFITDSHNGLLVKNYEDENSLARVIERAAMDEDLRTSILNNAPHSVRQFSKDYVDRWEVMLYRMFLHTQNYTHNDG